MAHGQEALTQAVTARDAAEGRVESLARQHGMGPELATARHEAALAQVYIYFNLLAIL